MNSKTNGDNTSPRARRVAQKTISIKSFVIGDVAQSDGLDESFTSPILKATRKHLINDDAAENEPSKRRKRNPWTVQEDARLMELVQLVAEEEGSSETSNSLNFSKVARDLNSGRNAKQCRDRWKNYLRGGIKKGSWTTDEEELIKDMYTTFGPKWCAMAKLLVDRTDNDIKNKWYSMKRKEERMGVHESVNAFAGREVTDEPWTNDQDETSAGKDNADGSYQQRNWGRKAKAV